MQDDILYPEHLSSLVAACERHPTAGLAFAPRDLLSEEETSDDWQALHAHLHESWSRPLREGLISGRELLRDRNFLKRPHNKIGEPSSVLLRRAAVLATGPFHTGLPQSLDFEYWYRVMARYDVCFVDRPLSAFRRHPGQVSAVNTTADFNKSGKETIMVYRSYLRHLARHLNLRDRYTLYRLVWRNTLRRKLAPGPKTHGASGSGAEGHRARQLRMRAAISDRVSSR